MQISEIIHRNAGLKGIELSDPTIMQKSATSEDKNSQENLLIPNNQNQAGIFPSEIELQLENPAPQEDPHQENSVHVRQENSERILQSLIHIVCTCLGRSYSCLKEIYNRLDSAQRPPMMCYSCVAWTFTAFYFCMFCSYYYIFPSNTQYTGPNAIKIAASALELYKNLIALPISDVILDSECLPEYEPLDIGTWPAISPICYDDGTAPLNTFASSCSFIFNGVPASEDIFWKGQTLCAKKITEVSNSSSPCPEGYTECYPGVCVYGTECGITEIHFERSSRTGEGWHSVFYNGSDLNSSTYINYRKDTSVLPIIKIIIHAKTPHLVAVPRLDLRNLPECLSFDLQTFLNRSQDLKEAQPLTLLVLIFLLMILNLFSACMVMLSDDSEGLRMVLMPPFLLLLFFVMSKLPTLTGSPFSELASYYPILSSLSDSKCFVSQHANLVITEFLFFCSKVVSIKKMGLALSWVTWAFVTPFMLFVCLLPPPFPRRERRRHR